MRGFMGGTKLSFIVIALVVAGCGEVQPPHWVTKIQALIGIPEAQSELGRMYLIGDGVAQDSAKAVEWYQKAVAQGYAHAQFSLGASYAHGQGVPKDAAKAVELWQKSAAQGHTSAQSALGNAYAKGEGVPKDAAKAVEWYQKAAVEGDSDAPFQLGEMYREGNGVPKDAAKAIEWYQKAAKEGNFEANTVLGTIYAIGDGVPKDATKAVEWYQKAVAQKHFVDPDAQFFLGVMFSTGEGVTKNPIAGVEWIQKAADRGHVLAQIVLGEMYAKGDGVPMDAAKAVEWYQKAAGQLDPMAQFNLGVMYAKGQGVVRDMVLAYAWFNIAAVSGNPQAVANRRLAESLLSKNELAEAQRLASEWKPGKILVRSGKSSTASVGKSSTSGVLTKQGTGTLFVVSKAGHAITNWHVTDGCAELRIEGREGVAKRITEDAANDLALLQIPGGVEAVASIANDPSKLRQGEDVVVFGFPLSTVLSSGGNLTPGVVSAITGLGNNTNQIQITAPIQPGSSGSPVLNKKGEVVGVVSMKLSDTKMVKATGSIGQNVNFAISGQTLRTFLDTHKVEYRSGGFLSFEKSTADLADEARKWTLAVECWK